MKSAINPNIEWSHIVVDELATCGLQAVCVAPGSRSTPLTLTVEQHPGLALYLHLDERSAAFFALGMAQATDQPVALICTSGTAAAEFYPAIIEAHQSHIPLLILTADRPHELRHSGANQTIDQVKLYGDHVLWAVDMDVPHIAAPAVVRRQLHTLAARAYATADGCTTSLAKGPVHINFPFRKPLEPVEGRLPSSIRATHPAVQMARGCMVPTTEQIGEMAALIDQHPHGLILCGPRCPGGTFPQAVAQLAQRTGYPLLVDGASGVRFGPHTADIPLVSGYETFLRGTDHPWAPPDVVLRFGAVPTSKWLNEYLVAQPPKYYLHLRANGVWADDSHLITHFYQLDEAQSCVELCRSMTARAQSNWATHLLEIEAESWAVINQYLDANFFDGAVVAQAIRTLPQEINLFIGNSLPIRHLDQLAQAGSTAINVFANRGASGIDGTTSTALGIAAAKRSAPLLLITGDVAFYHDLNGLLAMGQHSLQNVTILLLNNNGGGIFRRLPISTLEPPFTKLFLTPHNLDFAHAARLYNLAHTVVTDRGALQSALIAAIHTPTPHLIEVQTDGARDQQHIQAINQQVQAAISAKRANSEGNR